MRKSASQNPVQFQSLESRLMFCGSHSAFSTMVGTFPAMGSGSDTGGAAKHTLIVPVLNSRAGAPATIYLDFNGDNATTWGSYDVDATPAFQGTSADINQIWQRVAEKFSLFNVNVTTVNPGTFGDKQALHVVVGGDGDWTGATCGGISYVGSFYNYAPNTAYIFSENLGEEPKYVAEAIAHESGHAFGLQHQSRFNGATKVEEYSTGNGGDSAPIMGNSYSAPRGIWWYGTDTNNTMQDDIAIIAGANNGFGLRSDDHGSGMSNARNTRFSNNKFVMKGVMNTLSDRDFFKITMQYGQLQLKLRADGSGAMLDAKFRLYRADGSTVVATDGTGLGENITRTLPAGTYYALVYSHGTYGDVGQYAMYAYYTSAAPAGPAAPRFSPVGGPSLFSTQQIGSVVKQIEGEPG